MRLCFDVDGVLADDRSGNYLDRVPYEGVAERLRLLKAEGHTIIIQTARHMLRFAGHQENAKEYGESHLLSWLKTYNIPFDEVYMGKASADIYIDDKACRVRSVSGSIDWEESLAPRLSIDCPKL